MTHRSIVIVAGLGVLALTSPTLADDLLVPSQHRNVRKALRAAQPGDRIVLAEGRHSGRITVKTDDIEIVGEPGAVWDTKKKVAVKIRADNVTISGIEFRGTGIDARGDGVTLENLEIQSARLRSLIRIRGDDGRIEGTEISRIKLTKRARTMIWIEGDDAALTGNSVADVRRTNTRDDAIGAYDVIRIEGASADLVDNSVSVAVAGNAGTIVGDGAVVTDNFAEITTHGIRVFGNDAQVSENAVMDGVGVGILVEGDAAIVDDNSAIRRLGEGVTIKGDPTSVSGNSIDMRAPSPVPLGEDGVVMPAPDVSGAAWASASECPAVVVIGAGEGAAIERNQVTGFAPVGMHIESTGATIASNTVADVSRDTVASTLIIGDGNTVEGNTWSGDYGRSLQVDGDNNTIVGNTGAANSSALTRDRYGFTISGSDNVIEGNTIHLSRGDAIVVNGDRNAVCRNDATETRGEPGNWGIPAMTIDGDDNLVEENHVQGQDISTRGVACGVLVKGDRNDIDGNLLDRFVNRIAGEQFAICVVGSANGIEGNLATNYLGHGVQVIGSGNAIDGNTVDQAGVRSSVAGNGYEIVGDVNSVTTNVSIGATESGFVVDGWGNTVQRNCAIGARDESFVEVAPGTNTFDANVVELDLPDTPLIGD